MALAAAMALPLGISGGFSGSSETLSSTMKQESSSLNVKNFLPKKEQNEQKNSQQKKWMLTFFHFMIVMNLTGKYQPAKERRKKKFDEKLFNFRQPLLHSALC